MQCSTFYVTDIPSPKPKCPSSYNSRVQTHLDHCCHQKSSLPFQLTSLIYSNNDWANLKPSPSMELAKEKVGGWWETKWELDVIKGVMSGRRSRGGWGVLGTPGYGEIWSPKGKVTEKNVSLPFYVFLAYHHESAPCRQKLLLVHATPSEHR